MLRLKQKLSLEPSKKLIRLLDRLQPCDHGPILDAPSGFGRNALALADRGYHVIAVDRDEDRLAAVKNSERSRIHGKGANADGKVSVVCVDLTRERVPFGGHSFSAVICIHYPVQRIVSDLIDVVDCGGHIYVETFQGHGKNYLELPRAGEILFALRNLDIVAYNERRVGPPSEQATVVEALARKRSA